MIPDGPTLLLFVAAGLALNLTPGPDLLYIVARSLDQGRAAGLVSAAGIAAGSLVHATAAALGIGLLLQASPLAYDLLRYAGAGYLAWLGLQALRRPGGLAAPGSAPSVPLRRIFLQGLLTNLLNPKVALFFLAFLPQFTDPGRGPLAPQILLLGLIFIHNGFWVCAAVAWLAAQARRWLARSPRAVGRLQRGSGLMMLALGLHVALVRGR